MRNYAAYALLFAVPVLVPHVSYGQAGSPSKIVYDPLRWDDLVIKGKVESVTYSRVRAEEWYSPPLLRFLSGPVDLMMVALSEVETLRGNMSPSKTVLHSLRPATPHDELTFNSRVSGGADVIVTCLYFVERDLYTLHFVFAKVDDGWSMLGEEGWQEPISLSEINERVASVSIETMTRESDLVVGARVVSSRDVGEPGASHKEFVVTPYVVLKGSPPASIKITTRQNISLNGTEWRKIFPFDLAEGSSWYLFLKKEGGHYAPTAGRRSAFRVVGTELFEGFDVPGGLGIPAFEKEIRAVAAE